jgi:hypothetical protein
MKEAPESTLLFTLIMLLSAFGPLNERGSAPTVAGSPATALSPVKRRHIIDSFLI